MISIELDGLTGILTRLNHMSEQLRDLKGKDLSHEFREWQVEDVHRQKPFIQRRRGRPLTLVTRFRPHSWARMRHHRAAQRRLIRRGRYIGVGSSRPILRQTMIDRLEERITDLLQSIHW
jgi:hypothetical protein